MRTYKTVKHSYNAEHIEEITCCLCGKPNPVKEVNQWGQGFDVEGVVIKYKWGQSFPEGGSGGEIEFDVCPQCFENKVVPWFKSNGATAYESDWDF